MPALVSGANGSTGAKPKVLIPEKVSPDGLALLNASLEVHERKGLTPEQLIEVVPDYEALIVRSETKVTADLLTAGKKLKVVARAGVGVDNVDLAAATKLGVIVVNSPSGNINAAAEHTVALMMASARNVPVASASMKAGKWERSKFVGVEMKGKTLGIVGAGKVGLTVARIANGMGMNVIAYDPYANPALCSAASVSLLPTLDEIIEKADFFTIHTPLIASTRGMIGAAELAKMKPTARVMNVARGGMIDEAALLEALEKGTIAGAGMDVFSSEPPQEGSDAARLIAHPKVVATPHLGASTVEAQENVSIDVCEQVLAILSGALPRSAVNAPIMLPEEYKTLFPFVELVEKMGSIYTQHYTRSLHKTFRTTFELTYEGQLANLNNTKPLFAALVKGLLAPISSSNELNVNIVNAELVAKERGLVISESRSREVLEMDRGYSSFVTLRARAAHPSRSNSPAANRGQASAHTTMTTTNNAAAAAAAAASPNFARTQSSLLQGPRVGAAEDDQVIAGYVSGNVPRISRLDRFSTNFVARGNLLICRNFDSCGKIGFVGSRLGTQGVNISFMTVAPLEKEVGEVVDEGKTNEALMILGVDRLVDDSVRQGLIGDHGVLECTAVTL